MSPCIEADGANIRIGEKCSVNGRATVSVEFVMTEGEREDMLQRLYEDEVVAGREDVIEALNLAEPEGS
jgi:hypothetical protein